jgi:hypothetical protein
MESKEKVDKLMQRYALIYQHLMRQEHSSQNSCRPIT